MGLHGKFKHSKMITERSGRFEAHAQVFYCRTRTLGPTSWAHVQPPPCMHSVKATTNQRMLRMPMQHIMEISQDAEVLDAKTNTASAQHGAMGNCVPQLQVTLTHAY